MPAWLKNVCVWFVVNPLSLIMIVGYKNRYFDVRVGKEFLQERAVVFSRTKN